MASNKVYKTIEITCTSNEEKKIVGDMIHNQLVGLEDYINSNIILNIDEDCKILVVIFDDCKHVPSILI